MIRGHTTPSEGIARISSIARLLLAAYLRRDLPFQTSWEIHFFRRHRHHLCAVSDFLV